MIISHKFRFVFIKTKKTAGTSIEAYLSRVCGEDDIVTPVFPLVPGHRPRNFTGFWNPMHELRHAFSKGGSALGSLGRQWVRRERFYNHMPGWRIQHRVAPDIWNSYYRFTVDRNPYDKTLSHFYMLKRRENGDLDFQRYLRRGVFCINFPLYWCEGRLLVDKVLRYENLNEELGVLFERLGIPWDGVLADQAKANYREDRRHYDEVLSVEEKQIIAERFSKEFALNGYTI